MAKSFDYHLRKKIVKTFLKFDDFSFWVIGNGSSISTQKDNWVSPNCKLVDLIPSLPAKLLNFKVCDLIGIDGNWYRDAVVFEPTFSGLTQSQHIMVLARQALVWLDVVVWFRTSGIAGFVVFPKRIGNCSSFESQLWGDYEGLNLCRDRCLVIVWEFLPPQCRLLVVFFRWGCFLLKKKKYQRKQINRVDTNMKMTYQSKTLSNPR